MLSGFAPPSRIPQSLYRGHDRIPILFSQRPSASRCRWIGTSSRAQWTHHLLTAVLPRATPSKPARPINPSLLKSTRINTFGFSGQSSFLAHCFGSSSSDSSPNNNNNNDNDTWPVRVLPEFCVKEHWRLVRVLCSFALKKDQRKKAIRCVEVGVRKMPLSNEEMAKVLVPFLADAVEEVSVFEDLLKTAKKALNLDQPQFYDYGWIHSIEQLDLRLVYSSILLKYLLEHGHVVQALDHFRKCMDATDPSQLRSKDVRTLYGTVIYGLCKRNLTTEAVALLHQGIMHETMHYTPHISNVTPILEGMARKQQPSKIFDTLEYLLIHRPGFFLDRKACQIAYWACLRSVGFYDSRKRVHYEKDGGLEKVDSAVSLFLHGLERLSRSHQHARDMPANNSLVSLELEPRPDIYALAYNAMLVQHVKQGSLVYTETILRKALDRGVFLSDDVLEGVRDLYPRNSAMRDAVEDEIRRVRKRMLALGTASKQRDAVHPPSTNMMDDWFGLDEAIEGLDESAGESMRIPLRDGEMSLHDGVGKVS
ncbi:hypothetical protein HDU79_008091 [Rhizoclosmatium sp. JEL0117]|nr:hypothetical protein HDU79_008091 [Rhizoclosmatium sp. JEL0117]